MPIQRVTQNMITSRSIGSLQTGLSKLAKLQEQMTTGKVINRPSDSPTDTTSAMRIRSSLADVKQYGRNAADGNAWLTTIDSALTSANDQVLRARDLALQGANSGVAGPTAREALASEVDQIRGGLIDTANSNYLGRPVFGGVTAGAPAAMTMTASVGDIYPNPASGSCSLTLDLPAGGARLSARVIDMLGRTVMEVPEHRAVGGRSILPLDIPGVPAGSYICLVTLDGRTIARKLVTR